MHFVKFSLNGLNLKTKVLRSLEDLVINNRHSVPSTGSLESDVVFTRCGSSVNLSPPLQFCCFIIYYVF